MKKSELIPVGRIDNLEVLASKLACLIGLEVLASKLACLIGELPSTDLGLQLAIVWDVVDERF